MSPSNAAQNLIGDFGPQFVALTDPDLFGGRLGGNG
jgi:hypothetical protein